NDEPEVGLHELALGGVAAHDVSTELTATRRGDRLRGLLQLLERASAGFDVLSETNLVILVQQRILPDVGEIEPYEVFLITFDTFFSQCPQPSHQLCSSTCSRRSGRS